MLHNLTHFPQGKTDPSTLESVLDMWERERGLRDGLPRAVYISTPITSGPRFLQWYGREGKRILNDKEAYWRGMRAFVILPNRQAAGNYIETLRWQMDSPIIDPSAFDMPNWEQEDYHQFWLKVLEKHVRRVIFMDGWEFSTGCTLEFEHALHRGISCLDQRLNPIDANRARDLLEQAISQAKAEGLPLKGPWLVYERLRAHGALSVGDRLLFKDEVLDRLARTSNVAQFVSFAPNTLESRFSRIAGQAPNAVFKSTRTAIEALLAASPEGKVNVRSFDPSRPEGNPFLKNLDKVEHIQSVLISLGKAQNLHTIINECIDESDGGVSGVAHRGVLEFAPDATPRVVDDPSAETAYLPFPIGMRMLELVYGVRPALDGFEGARVEFSLHPRPRGWNRMQTVIWQAEQRPGDQLKAHLTWPNQFSRLLGDKVYGLLLAHLQGLSVPRTMVFTARQLFPFSFGKSTGSGRTWTRTAPAVKVPGFYPSVQRWHDPYQMLREWRALMPDLLSPPPAPLASVLIQEGVEARFSGRALATPTRGWEIGGVVGTGEGFMLGDDRGEKLPQEVQSAVRVTMDRAIECFGALSIEWAFDGAEVWVLQLNSLSETVAPAARDGDIDWIEFRFEPGGIEKFREFAKSAQARGKGIVVMGNVSPLSHIGEIAEILGVPIRFSSR